MPFDFIIASISEIEELALPVLSSPRFLQEFQVPANSYLKYVICKNKENIVGVFPIFEKKKQFIEWLVNPYLIPYIKFNYFSKKKNINEILNFQNQINSAFLNYLTKRYFKISTNINPDNYDVRSFNLKNSTVTPLFTYIVDLKSSYYEDYFASAKKAIRKGEKAKLIISDDSDVVSAITLLEKTYTSQNLKLPYKKDDLINLVNALLRKNIIEFYNIKYENKMIAFRMVIPDSQNNTVYDWLAASDKEYNNLGINAFLIDYLLTKYSKKYRYFDFCGANIPSIARFKSSFGGKLTVFYKFNWYKNKLFKLFDLLRT